MSFQRQSRFLPAALFACLFAGGCSEAGRPPSVASSGTQASAAPAPKLDVVRVFPQSDAVDILGVYSTDYSEPRSDIREHAVIALEGGTPILHVIAYSDSVDKPNTPEERKSREIRAYHLLEFPPHAPDSEEREIELNDHTEEVDFHVRRHCIFQSSDGGHLLVRAGETATWKAAKTERNAKVFYDRGWASTLPRDLTEEIVVSGGEINKGTLPSVDFWVSISRGYRSFVRRESFEIAGGTSKTVYDLDHFRNSQVAVSVESLPIPNPIAARELLMNAEAWQAAATSDADDVKAKYYFAWSALFLQNRTLIAAAKRRELLSESVKRIDEARRLEPKNPAFAALARRLALADFRTADDSDDAEIIRRAERLLELKPAIEECSFAARSLLDRHGPPPKEEVVPMVVRLVRRALLLSSPWDRQLRRDVRDWRNVNNKYQLPELDATIKEFEKSPERAKK